jgi:hypothetical protein
MDRIQKMMAIVRAVLGFSEGNSHERAAFQSPAELPGLFAM